jgi:hypothetical protein
MKKETLEEVKDLSYWKANAEEDYMNVPISVLRYISELEERSYSEEEVENILRGWSLYKIGIELEKLANEIPNIITYKEWFEQFKKK